MFEVMKTGGERNYLPGLFNSTAPVSFRSPSV